MKPDKQTWDLLIGALKGSLDDAEKLKFEAWITETGNRRFYDNLTHVWREIQQRAADYEPDRNKLWQQLQQRIGTRENTRSTPRRYYRVNSLLRTAAATAAAIVITLLIARPDLLRSAAGPAEQQICAFEGKSLARLADGSTIWLHKGSALAYDARFNGKERNVKLLRGEGFFDIAKDPRPFTVEVQGLKVRVHGTKFNVRTSAADNTVRVSLVEGSVSLDAGSAGSDDRKQLCPGEIARYNADTRRIVVERGDVAMESCWAAGKLSFEKQPLGEIGRYMARWYGTEIQIDRSIAHDYAYTFTITDEPLEEILRIMSRINPIVYTFAKDNSVSISELE